MDPAMVATTHWLWHLPGVEGASVVRRIALSNLFYGMPLTNWLGWLLTGFVVARVMLAIVPPRRWAERVSPTRLPLVLYAVNGILPIMICVGRGLWWAVALGGAAMALPLVLALRAGARGVIEQGEGAEPTPSGVGGPPDNKFAAGAPVAASRHGAADRSDPRAPIVEPAHPRSPTLDRA
jgi:uncharacterized membrane protein